MRTPTELSGAPAAVSSGEELISLNQVRNLPALRRAGRGDRRADPATIHRWCRDGVLTRDHRRVRLESIRLGGKRMTTRSAVARFLADLNRTGPAPIAEVDAVRLAHLRAEAELDTAGI
jgi:hypothetical protein